MSHLYSEELNYRDRLLERISIGDIQQESDDGKEQEQEEETEKDAPLSRLDAEALLRKKGIHVLGKPPGELMLLAAQQGLLSVIKSFKGTDTPMTYKNNFRDTLLHFAAKGGQTKAMWYLLREGLDVNAVNKFEETALFMASEEGHLDVVKILCRQKAINLLHQDKFGDTALHFAAREGYVDICDYLLRKEKGLLKIKNQVRVSLLVSWSTFVFNTSLCLDEQNGVNV